MADAEKAKGNEFFKAGDFKQAIEHFSNAINILPSHVHYSNRSACFCSLKEYGDALTDAELCIKLNPSWGKGYGRKGAALHGMGQFEDAIKAYQEGLQVEPGLAMLTNGLADAKKELSRGGGDAADTEGLSAIFAAPDALSKIASNPMTASFLADPEFMAKFQEIQNNPGAISKHLGDQRILQVMGTLMGVNIQTPDSMGGTDFGAGRSALPPKKKAPGPVPEPEPMLTPEEEEKRARKKEADGWKEKGNVHYKAKEFAEAIGMYEKAVEILPNEVTYYNNLAAVKMEQTDYDGCIATCRKGIELGREVQADFKLIAKSFARIGNAYLKMDKLTESIRAYEDSLMEDRTEDVQRQLKKVQARKKKEDEEAYVSPEMAETCRQEGNELFKAGKYADALAKYSEAMKRNPKDHVPYSNRAACYQKLMEWQLALKDVDTCIAMDGTFVKGWSRKASIHHYLKEFHKAIDAYNKILELDPENAEAKQQIEHVLWQVNQQNQSGEVDKDRQARAMADPEIQAILGDAQMRSILSEMQTDPKKAQAALQDPAITEKLNKLIAAGVLQVR